MKTTPPTVPPTTGPTWTDEFSDEFDGALGTAMFVELTNVDVVEDLTFVDEGVDMIVVERTFDEPWKVNIEVT
jgi:hypothetical protein